MDGFLRYYDHFVLPFTVGMLVLFTVIIYKYVRWFVRMPKEDRRLVARGIFTKKTAQATGEVACEALGHRKIWRVNPTLGYMHMSLALGWFLLIVVGWIEATVHFSGELTAPHTHVFFKFFGPTSHPTMTGKFINFMMDFLLLFVLSGVALAWFKRLRSKALGMRRTTRHTLWDRVAMTALWMIFPVRLVAESAASGIDGSQSFLTGAIGRWMVDEFGIAQVFNISAVAWWVYSLVLGAFFLAMPFSRYMHIFTEIPLIFMRRYGVRSGERASSFDHFQIEACSQCGVCIDPCQLQADAGINHVQSAYYLRDRRYNRLRREVAENCLMCGRCEAKCPVGIESNTLRLNSRSRLNDQPAEGRYEYLRGVDGSCGEGRTGYFAGCMTMLTPATLSAMEKVFAAAGEDVWWADRNGGACCGRPLRLLGEIAAAQRMTDHNVELILRQGVTILVVSCPICLRAFRGEPRLADIEILHHSQYILRLVEQGRILMSSDTMSYVYHDPCELGRGCGIYDEPREVLRRLGTLAEVSQNREHAFCCGGSLANAEIDSTQQDAIARTLMAQFAATDARVIVTACPLCKKMLARHSSRARVADISEVAAARAVAAATP
ncbi:MAG: (Fe-S)-binding protein [Rikenellaceae bacterium]|nr:(Fe-S)-binding protein [Rikenellaceae bacterium]MCL2692830.1 (Fe-S)-binding protein [Rikenellaceae bacterium]